MLLGAGPAAVRDLGIGTIGDALRPEAVDARVIDGDPPTVRYVLRPG